MAGGIVVVAIVPIRVVESVEKINAKLQLHRVSKVDLGGIGNAKALVETHVEVESARLTNTTVVILPSDRIAIRRSEELDFAYIVVLAGDGGKGSAPGFN